MADQVRGTEEFFLKLVKNAILVLMGLALLAIPLLLIYGGANYMSQAKEPEPAKKMQAKEVTMDGLQQYLLEEQKRQEEAEKFDPSKKKATEQDQPPAIYLSEAVKVLGCSYQFAVATGALIDANQDSKSTTEEAVRLRERIESSARRAGRGGPYVESLVKFFCKALADPGVIALKKADKFKGSIVRAVLSYHEFAWDKIVAENNQFEAAEQARVMGERAAEALRIATDRARAIAALTGAASAFAAFMLLAIYLILAKIETNMRDINGSIRAHENRAIT